MADIKAEGSKQRDPLSSLKWASREEARRSQYLACPIRQVVSRFGDKWSMLVLYMLHTSETGILRFNEIRRLMTDLFPEDALADAEESGAEPSRSSQGLSRGSSPSRIFPDRDRQVADACAYCAHSLGQGAFQ